MYIIYDKSTGEYFNIHGEWIGVEDDHIIHHEASVFPTAKDAEAHLKMLLGMWDKRYPVPSIDEYEIREVRARGWVFVD